MATKTKANATAFSDDTTKKSYQASWLETIVFGFAFTFVIVWSFGHGSAYFFWNAAEIFEDFKNTLFIEGIHPAAIAEGFRDCCLGPIMVHPRLTSLRLHIALAASSGLMMIMQLLPQVRTRNYQRHRFIGYVVNTLVFVFIIQMTYLIFYRGLLGLPNVIFWFDLAAYIAIVVGYVFGGVAIYQRDIKTHRAMMMLCTAGMLMNAVQRFFWAVFSKTNTKVKTYDEWVEGPLTQSSIVTTVLNLGAALYYGLGTVPLPSDMIRSKVVRRDKVA